jgi:hypothetical protein
MLNNIIKVTESNINGLKLCYVKGELAEEQLSILQMVL